jgi:hypothetical protein
LVGPPATDALIVTFDEPTGVLANVLMFNVTDDGLLLVGVTKFDG